MSHITPVSGEPAGLSSATKVSLDNSHLPNSPLWAADYNQLGVSSTGVPPWTVEQMPSVGGTVQQRITVVTSAAAPGTDIVKPTGSALRVELRPYSATNPGTTSPADGDVTDLSGSLTNRSEVYGRAPTFMSGTPAAQWPDPVGSERWYSFSLCVDPTFVAATDTRWLVFAQWKGYHGGSPPLSMEIKRGNFRLGGTRTNAALIPNDGTLSPVVPGVWTRFVVGMRLSTDPTVGWVEVWQDGVQVLARTSVSTMDTFGGSGDANADPIYLKQGIYRDTAWAVTHVFHFGPAKVGTSRASVTAAEVLETSAASAARIAAIPLGGTLETSTVAKDGGVAAAGVATTASASDHVHSNYYLSPADKGLITETFDVAVAQAASSATNGALQFNRVRIPKATTVTNILLNVVAAGTGFTAGQNFAALYDGNRNLLGVTADQSTNWASTGVMTMPLASSVAVTGGFYYLAFWVRATGAPTFSRGLSNLLVNAGLTSTNMRFGISTTALTTTAPATAAAPTAGAVAWWMACT